MLRFQPQLGVNGAGALVVVIAVTTKVSGPIRRQPLAHPSAFRSIHDVATSINSHVTSSQSEKPTIPEFSDPWGLPASRTLSAFSVVPLVHEFGSSDQLLETAADE
jgi:hypothetical protein